MTPRIVSLLPSATEIVSALGLRDRLVGRSHECDFPDGVEALPVCTEPKMPLGLTSSQIHANVTEVLRNDVSVYRVHADLLRRLRPTHIVTQIQCEVCAVSLKDVEAALGDWECGDGLQPVPERAEARSHIVVLNARSLSGVFDDIRRTASALDAPAAGERVVARMRDSFESIRTVTAGIETKPRVATIEWLDPLMAAGNWMPELVEIAGGVNVFGKAGAHSPWLSFAELVAGDPEVLIILPCGFTIEQSERDLLLLEQRAEWRELRAVRNGNVYVTDGNQFFNRPGPRLAESARILAEILHPGEFKATMRYAWNRRAVNGAPASAGAFF